ncbi:hypothetical protein Bbelb_309860 [Branchiostoma belcheri]|nr:hypothetical protein Bbelb_309860 [Branchiostoma belcheri]
MDTALPPESPVLGATHLSRERNSSEAEPSPAWWSATLAAARAQSDLEALRRLKCAAHCYIVGELGRSLCQRYPQRSPGRENWDYDSPVVGDVRVWCPAWCPAYCNPTVTTRRTCFCVLSTCKNVGNRTASVRAYERATYGLRESNFTILTCNCCTDSARSMCVPRTVLASSVLTPHFPVDLLNDHAEHTCTIPVYKDDLTGDCQLVSKMPRKAQKKTTRRDPKKRAAEDTRAASDDEVNRRCTHLQRASE